VQKVGFEKRNICERVTLDKAQKKSGST